MPLQVLVSKAIMWPLDYVAAFPAAVSIYVFPGVIVIKLDSDDIAASCSRRLALLKTLLTPTKTPSCHQIGSRNRFLHILHHLVFHSASRQFRCGTSLSNELKYKEQAFDEKIEKIFNLAEKVDSESISVGNAAVGSLLDGIDYFYGQSKIALSRTLNFRKHVDYVSYWPAEPYTAVPKATSVGGFYAINRRGQVLLATVNEQTIVNFVSGQLNNLELAVSLAKRGNLPGAEKLVVERFHELFAQTKYKKAAELASQSPQGILRTPDTVAKFQSVPVQAGQTPPLLQYFGTLLTRGKPNAFESLELSRLVVNQNKKNLLENWLAEDKFECSEELGDLVKIVDNDLALKIYIKARANSNGSTSKQEHEQRLLQQHCRTNTRPNANLTRPVKLSLNGIGAGPQIILQCKDSPTKL
ncbi:hypothetical protein KIW84_035279 [Lathyrus oleraceus]|uniref:Clathrin heavy chain linker core motif domain-containing protein n=1 Tax=Pisum sativum TaxID=3888 RepID=A0A9D5B5H8_PEA|nr:hypothetical protein KIW84_035279 [Pisum sativum]